jgi:uncharacterized membrane protein YccC
VERLPAWPERLRPLRPDFLLHPLPGAWSFALRTALAASPYWAATTALIVANPVYGQIVSKSFYRVLGTLAGGGMALILTALFAQTPEVFILALATWVGCCLTVATLLRSFQAYGAMLAGLSTAIITLAVIEDHPLRIFEVTMSRVSAITVGIAASALVSGLLKPRGAVETMELKLQATIREAAGLLGMLADPKGVLEVKDRRRTLSTGILTLSEVIDFAGFESPRIRNERNGLLAIGGALLHVITAVGNAAYSINRMEPWERENTLLREALAQVKPAADSVARLKPGCSSELDPINEQLLRLEREAAAQNLEDVLVVIHRIQEVVEQLTFAARAWLDWKAGKALTSLAYFEFHREVPDALRNGTRCFLAVALAGAFWIATAWSSGAGLVIIVTVACSFGAIQEDPLAFGPSFLTGVFWLIPTCLICEFVLLNQISNFLPVAFVLMIFVMVPAMASASPHPRTSGVGKAYMALLFTLLALRNPMSFNFAGFLNNSLVNVAGVVCAIVCTVFFLPPDPVGRARRLVRILWWETESLARHEGAGELPMRSVWESRMYDRLRLTRPHLSTRPEELTMLDSAYAAVLIGASVIELRRRAQAPEMPAWARHLIDRTLERLGGMRDSSQEVARDLTEAARQLMHPTEDNAGPASSGLMVRCASSLRGIAVLLGDNAASFDQLRPGSVGGWRL